MYKCLRCGSTYKDDDPSILKGCPKCGYIFFYYIKEPKEIKEIEKVEEELKLKKTTMEEEVRKGIERKPRRVKGKFGIETIKIPREGVYEINLDALMKKRPVIVLQKERVYIIHLPTVFQSV